MHPEPAIRPPHSRARIMAKVATVLREADSGITSIESAITRSGISEQEVCDSFGGKRKLLVAMVSELSDSMAAPLALDSKAPHWSQRLLEFGERVTDVYARSHLRGLYRIAITESIRHTGLGRDFYQAGPGRLTQRLSHFLEAAQTEGALRCADPDLAASHFLSLLRVDLDVADTFPGDAAVPVAGGAYVRSVVDVFSHGIGGGRQS